MYSKEEMPMMMSASDIQAMGLTRTMAYAILNREDVPVVTIGKRKFVQRDRFFEWLASQENTDLVNEQPDKKAGGKYAHRKADRNN